LVRQASRQPLSAADGAWWRMEHPTNRMTITAVFTFAGPLSFASLAALLAEKLVAPYPRFRQRVVDGGAGGGYWEDDPAFALAEHVVPAALPDGAGQEALQRLVSELMSAPLPEGRSPWQFHVIEGYRGRTALVARVHHCMGDGLSLVQVLLAMADRDAGGAAGTAARSRCRWTRRRGGVARGARWDRSVRSSAPAACSPGRRPGAGSRPPWRGCSTCAPTTARRCAARSASRSASRGRNPSRSSW
jgi:hypothetical protein